MVVRETGAFFALMSVMMVLVQGPLLSWLARRVSEKALIIAGGVILGPSFLLYTGQESLPIYAGAALLALGNGIMWPSLVAVLSSKAGEHQGEVQGFAGSAGAVASILGLVLGGILFGHLGARTFALSCWIILAAVFLCVAAHRRTEG